MEHKIRPMDNRVLILLDKPLESEPEGLDEPFEKKLLRGKIVACGKGHFVLDGNRAGMTLPMQLQVGQRVMLSNYAGMDEIDSHRVLVSEGFILATIEEATDGPGPQ